MTGRGPVSNALRVCMLLETYWPQVGGGETAGRLLARGLASHGCNVEVLTRRSVPGVPVRDTDGGVRIRRLPPTGSGSSRKWLLSVPATASLLYCGGYDVLVVLGFRILGAPAVVAARVRGRPVVLKAESRGEMSGEFFRAGLEKRGLRPGAAPVRAVLALRNRFLLRADAFVAMSSELVREFEAGDVMPDRIHLIPNAVDTARFLPVDAVGRLTRRVELSLPVASSVVVYAGRLVTYKGLPELIEAWPRVLTENPNAYLVLVGEGGSDQHACEDELRKRVEILGLSGSIRFAGPTTDVVRWLQAADAAVLPTRDEAFGLGAIEAMACGLPLVTTTVGGLADVVSPNRDAIVVEPGSAESIAGGLLIALAGGTGVAGIAAQARRTVEERYSLDRIVEAWFSLLMRLAGRS